MYTDINNILTDILVISMSASGIVVSLHEEDQLSTSETESGVKRFNVERVIMNPNYNRRNIGYHFPFPRM